ncbi:MAG: hypothetical protein ACT4OK_17985 [Gemmobacter sp.]
MREVRNGLILLVGTALVYALGAALTESDREAVYGPGFLLMTIGGGLAFVLVPFAVLLIAIGLGRLLLGRKVRKDDA